MEQFDLGDFRLQSPEDTKAVDHGLAELLAS